LVIGIVTPGQVTAGQLASNIEDAAVTSLNHFRRYVFTVHFHLVSLPLLRHHAIENTLHAAAVYYAGTPLVVGADILVILSAKPL